MSTATTQTDEKTPFLDHYIVEYHKEGTDATDTATTTGEKPGRAVRIFLPSSFSTEDQPSSDNIKYSKMEAEANEISVSPSKETSEITSIPESVLQYERQLRKVRAASLADRPIQPEDLQVLYADDDIVVAHKKSGILCVPGVSGPRKSSLLELVFDKFGFESGNDDDESDGNSKNDEDCPARSEAKFDEEEDNETIPSAAKNSTWRRMNGMVAHRLDMDTSGLVVFGRTPDAVRTLHEAFRTRQVKKVYHALVCGHVPFAKGLIDLPLQRDHRHPPFWRVATPTSEEQAALAVQDLQHAGWKKLVRKRPKPSQTQFEVLGHEYIYREDDKLPVTRLQLIPLTGRTHQLRIHCAAMGHSIVADPAYGWGGEAHLNGGYTEDDMKDMPLRDSRASLELQQSLSAQEGTHLCLHAAMLAFIHPTTQKWMEFEASSPF